MIDPNSVPILIADDRQEIIDDIRKILAPRQSNQECEIDALREEIFHTGKKSSYLKTIESPPETVSRYNIIGVNQGSDAITTTQTAIAQGSPFALAFIDIRMPPGIDGVKTAEILHRIDPQMYIVFMSAFSDYSRENILQILGPSARDKILYLGKPFSSDEIRHIAGNLSENWKKNKAILDQAAQAQKVHLATVHTLVNIIESRKGKNPEGPSIRIARYTEVFVKCMRKHCPPELANYLSDRYVIDIVKASIFYDIGNAGLSESVLSKKDFLEQHEHESIKEHCKLGYDAITQAINSIGPTQTYLHLAREIASSHHERYDGTGYPAGLKGDDIPLSARIVSIIGVYDALTSHRHHRNAHSHDEAIHIIYEDMGRKYFDPVILNAFKKCHTTLQKIKQGSSQWNHN